MQANTRAFLISIHALRVEGDVTLVVGLSVKYVISIHALRVEGDKIAAFDSLGNIDFYPRPPCGGRLCAGLCGQGPMEISIHALRVEGDQFRC